MSLKMMAMDSHVFVQNGRLNQSFGTKIKNEEAPYLVYRKYSFARLCTILYEAFLVDVSIYS